MAVTNVASKVAAAAPAATPAQGGGIRAHLPLIAFAALAGAAIFYLWRELQKARQALTSSALTNSPGNNKTATQHTQHAPPKAAPHEYNYAPYDDDDDSGSDADYPHPPAHHPAHHRAPPHTLPHTPHGSLATLQEEGGAEVKSLAPHASGINMTEHGHHGQSTQSTALPTADSDEDGGASGSSGDKPKPRRRTPRV